MTCCHYRTRPVCCAGCRHAEHEWCSNSFLADASAAQWSSKMRMLRQLWFAGADLLFSTSSA
jgi:hypothetical protein